MRTKYLTKAPKGFQVVLALWPMGNTPFDRVGAGHNYTGYGDSSGSVALNLRLWSNEQRTIHTGYMPGVGNFDRAVGDVVPKIYVSNGGDDWSDVSIRGHNIFHAEVTELEAIVVLMKAWEKRIGDLYMGGKESLDTKIRRLLKGVGAENAVLIRQCTNDYELIPIDEAIRKYINPAIDDIRKRLKVAA